MVGGIGWQGIVPSRAAKMGSLAVDSGIAKIGTPREFFQELDPEQIAAADRRLHARATSDEIVDRVMEREQPRLWRELPPQFKELVHRRVQEQLPEIVHELTRAIGDHIDQLVDVKLMVIKRFDPELANRVFLDMGQRELKFIQNFGFVFGFLLGIPVALLTHFVTFWWLLPILGVLVGYVTNWVALWMIYEPPEPRRWGPFRCQGLFIRRQHDVAEVYARIVADEILTVVGVRQRAAPRSPVRPHPGADRDLDAAGHRPRHRARARRRRGGDRPARVRLDPRSRSPPSRWSR